MRGVDIQFLGIGARKSATSWIAKCLSEHPSICMPDRKELHFFLRDEEYSKGTEYFNSYFRQCSADSVRGEYSTLYLFSEKALDRIVYDVPNVKLIVSLRNPVDRALSHIRHLQSKGKLPMNIPLSDAINRCPSAVENSKYALALTSVLRRFPRDHLHVVIVDDILKSPISVMQDLFLFLGVNRDFIPPSVNKPQNTSSERFSTLFGIKNYTYLKLRKYAVGRSVIRLVRMLGINNLIYHRNTFSMTASSGEELKLLSGYFEDDIAEVEHLLDINLPAWKSK